MGKKNGKNVLKKKKGDSGREPSYWMIVAIITLIFSVGLTVKVMLYSSKDIQLGEQVYQSKSLGGESLERQVLVVASEFKCACGGCGELPLIECKCDMPRGALEEKGFIRKKLGEGSSVHQVIQLVEKKYGYRIT